jgi:hypothetical protein
MVKKSYNLGFISDADFYEHVKNTIKAYRFVIDLELFNKNIVDPIKLTFDHYIYEKSLEDVIEQECLRQIDKSNNNQIGYFHQNIFKYLSPDWVVPLKGDDIYNKKLKIHCEMKNKHNTMNASSSQKTFMRMLAILNKDPMATCYLVEILAKRSQDIPWAISLDATPIKDERIRRISIDRFYELVTKDPLAFKKLCLVLPQAIQDVLKDNTEELSFQNTVIQELQTISPNILESLYLHSFKTYEGFDSFDV